MPRDLTFARPALCFGPALALAGLLAGPAVADGHAGISGYALADEGRTLVVMPEIAEPGMTLRMALPIPVRALAFRPTTGELLAFADGAVAVIDPRDGEMRDLGARFAKDAMIAEGAAVAFDFNNKIDAVRAVSTAGDNLVYFPEGFGGGDMKAGSVRRFTDLAYAEGDAHAGRAPMIFANAYTNAVAGGTAASTVQYALDAQTDALVTLANNAGTLETVAQVTLGGAPVDLAAAGGFDILSPVEGVDEAFAILRMEGETAESLYALDLESGALTRLGELGEAGFTSFAVAARM